MLLSCDRCELDFLPNRSEPVTRCPRCGAKHDSYESDSGDRRELLRIARRNHVAWMPRWLGTVGATTGAIFLLATSVEGARNDVLLGLSALGFTASVAWHLIRRTSVLEVGRGRLTASRTLAPWPGRWIPASAVERIAIEPEPVPEEQLALWAVLRGGAKVRLLDDVHPSDAGPLAEAIEAALRASAPGVLPEVHLASGEREVSIEWNCGRAVSVRIGPTSVGVTAAGTARLELDADFIDEVRVVPQSPERGMERFRLVASSARGTRVLLEGISAREPLDVVANEIRRVLRLELPPAVR